MVGGARVVEEVGTPMQMQATLPDSTCPASPKETIEVPCTDTTVGWSSVSQYHAMVMEEGSRVEEGDVGATAMAKAGSEVDPGRVEASSMTTNGYEMVKKEDVVGENDGLGAGTDLVASSRSSSVKSKSNVDGGEVLKKQQRQCAKGPGKDDEVEPVVLASRSSNALSGDDSGGEGEIYPPVSFLKLYSFADRFDVIAQILGIIGALGNGVIFPVFTVVFGEILDDIGITYYRAVYASFLTGGPDAPLPDDAKNAISDNVASTVPKFMYLGVGGMVAAFLQVFFLIYSSIRQTNKMREMYLKSVLKQDISYFDTKGTSGSLLQGLNEDCMKVQSAIGEKVSMFLFMISTAISGIIVGAYGCGY